MAVMIWQKLSMDELITRLTADFPTLRFVEGKKLCWSPDGEQIFYQNTGSGEAVNGLLHEVAHAVLGHRTYQSDLELLQKEVDAWQQARSLARKYGIVLDPEHVQNCLDTYRDWIFKRSRCPVCGTHGMQRTKTQYGCFNCDHLWSVSNSRFCRPYRRSGNIQKAAL